MNSIEITCEDGDSKGRYLARVEGMSEVAELSFSKASAAFVIADHTTVPGAMRGRGIGAMLAARLVDDARHGAYRILALCPFVRAQFARHPEWADVMWTDRGAHSA
ncbi:GNAT family N-acetyltransferase [Accumulibacter sp.]|uniref:GNAT family N-acetyltransferase n=1 Tax=Accumulibacter sp. TaxID=2053492 RepID=UPI002628A848|nr:GNAT family N-acetyltransferase [Accumulibacter sp.]